MTRTTDPGGPMHVEESGRGRAVLLLHGAPSSTADYAPLVAQLQGDHRVLVPELPGYGRSPRIAGKFSYAAVQEAVEGELLRRDIREVSVVGFSLGAYHALSLAARGNVRVTHAFLLGGWACIDDAGRAALREFVVMLRGGADHRSDDFRPVFVTRFLSPRFQNDPKAIAAVTAWAQVTTPDVLADELEAALTADVRPSLPALRTKVTARVGALDPATPPAASEEIVRLVPEARLQIVPNCSHALLLEDAQATIAAIRAGIA